MSILNYSKKYSQKVIITPKEHLEAEKDEFNGFKKPDSVIFCFEGYILEEIKKREKISLNKFWTGEIIYFKNTKNKVALVGNFGIGGPASCHLLEIFIAMGIKNYVIVGHAGGLQKYNPIGTIILCEKALRDEGTSYHYLKDSRFVFSDKKLNKKIEKELKQKDSYYKKGSTWTLDSMYRETLDEVNFYCKEGIDTVEMEAASMFAVAKFRRVHMSALFVISDYITSQKWEEHLYSQDTTKAIFQSIEVAKIVLSSCCL
ncbi:hypothetical protein CO172_01995 [Candidatus Uhrbacteria bacterium CG_4_9_14_3_um_filter_36_7]|uniref:Uridine phosphorylase n=1 Tax=Candidatus Uhrbacteria bacterium CG_4_9_14_3_um_filter_36_7 TaxID=1975033 RepID=A0A2M7XHG5_9BACT|nr:MAG: hypothetical protein CO172_01995 [Candidatus Uhrbacteria bacterium CG_4_9_14_3_um_filter_36_7]